MAEKDEVTNPEHEIEDHEDIEDPFASGGGTSLYSHPDQTEEVRQTQIIDQSVNEAIETERKFYSELGKAIVRVNTNMSGSIQFRRYEINAAMGAVMIVKEKRDRGDTVITCYTADGIVSVGKQSGLTALGMDTVSVVGSLLGVSRVIRTRSELWAITASITTVTFDVQEEFD